MVHNKERMWILLIFASIVAPDVLAIIQSFDCNVDVAPLLDVHFVHKLVGPKDDRLAERNHLILRRHANSSMRRRNESERFADHCVEVRKRIERRCRVLLR